MLSRARTALPGAWRRSWVIQAYQVVSGVIRYAIRTDRLVKNVTEGIELPSKPQKGDIDRCALTHRQFQELARETKHFEMLTLVLGYCGLRIGEAIALRRRDVGKETITVRASVGRVRGQGYLEGTPKTGKTRQVPVPAYVWDRLKAHLPTDPDALVFPSHTGGHMTIGEYRWVFDKARAKIRKAGLVPHELRHTTASLAISAGVNIFVVPRLVGHASAKETLDTYGHLMNDDLDRAASAMSEAARTAANGS
jgi:integrase